MTNAATGAARDREAWQRLLAAADTHLPTAREVDVTGFDPRPDLDRRARWWGHRFATPVLPEVLAFGVALAGAEVDAWRADDPVVATRAFADRRFLFGDRLIHWVVPLTYAVGASEIRAEFLGLGDRLRPAPLLSGDEGIHPPGEDSFGLLEVALRVELGPPERWRNLQAAHPGTARLWRDLAVRAGF